MLFFPPKCLLFENWVYESSLKPTPRHQARSHI